MRTDPYENKMLTRYENKKLAERVYRTEHPEGKAAKRRRKQMEKRNGK